MQLLKNRKQKKLSQEEISKVVYHCDNQEDVTGILAAIKEADSKSCPPSSLMALYLIQDLYSESSSDEANINRITTNLEAFAEDLYATSRFVKSLRQ